MARRRRINAHIEAQFEAALRGETTPEDLAGYEAAAFVDDVRGAATGPAITPSTMLSSMLAAGAASSAAPAIEPAEIAPSRSRVAAVAKLVGGLSLAGKLAFGAGVAAAAATGAGAAGVLPGPAQHALAVTVDAVTPFELPDEALDSAAFGARVSADATGRLDEAPGVDGRQISEEARERNAARECRNDQPDEAASRPSQTTEPTTTPDADYVTPDVGTDAKQGASADAPSCRPDDAGKPETTGQPGDSGQPDGSGQPEAPGKPASPGRSQDAPQGVEPSSAPEVPAGSRDGAGESGLGVANDTPAEGAVLAAVPAPPEFMPDSTPGGVPPTRGERPDVPAGPPDGSQS